MSIITQYVLPCLWAFIACAGFCLLYDIHGFGIVLCCLGGSVGWLTYLVVQTVSGSSPVAAFVAGLVIAGYAEIMARIRKCPASGYLLLAFFPLVPGAGVYYTMEYYLNGDTARFVATGRETLTVAGALALGVLLVSSLVRMINTFYRRRREHHAPL